VILAKAGDDCASGKGGSDSIYGGSGSDSLRGGIGRDRIYGGPDSDVIFARDRSRDRVFCGSGADMAVIDRRDSVKKCEFVRR
jgi:hemolysin A